MMRRLREKKTPDIRKDQPANGRQPQHKALKFFVHVPKAAGSSINAALMLHNPNGKIHCQSIINNIDQFSDTANRVDWLSGHVDLATAGKAISEVTERPVEYYACMRFPCHQVSSHYNWLMEIYYRGQKFYENHPPRIKEISEKIRNSNNSSVQSIIENLKEYSALFLNYQSRFILGRGFNWNAGKLYQKLGEYTMLVENTDARKLTGEILGTETFEFSNQNESTYRFDKSLFDHPDMVEFLRENNTLDEILFGMITAGKSKKRENAR